METFYCFGSEGYMTTFAARPALFELALEHDLHGYDSGREIHHHLLYGDYVTKEYPAYIQFPVSFIQLNGKRMRDVLDMRFDGQCVLISDRMRDVLRDAGITGWRTYPIRLFDKKGNEVAGYNGLTITGRGGKMTYMKSSLERTSDDYWASEQWDGSDFFWVKPNFVIVTEKVRMVCRSNKIDALHFFRLSDIYKII